MPKGVYKRKKLSKAEKLRRAAARAGKGVLDSATSRPDSPTGHRPPGRKKPFKRGPYKRAGSAAQRADALALVLAGAGNTKANGGTHPDDLIGKLVTQRLRAAMDTLREGNAALVNGMRRGKILRVDPAHRKGQEAFDLLEEAMDLAEGRLTVADVE